MELHRFKLLQKIHCLELRQLYFNISYSVCYITKEREKEHLVGYVHKPF